MVALNGEFHRDALSRQDHLVDVLRIRVKPVKHSSVITIDRGLSLQMNIIKVGEGFFIVFITVAEVYTKLIVLILSTVCLDFDKLID